MAWNPEHPELISRREAILRLSVLLGGVALVGGNVLLTGCSPDGRRRSTDQLFTQDDIALLDEIADTILPETSSPGAKAAQTGAFMALMVTDTYDESDQDVFREGLRTVDERCQEMHGTSFMAATPAQRLALVERLDQEAMEHMNARSEARRRRDAEAADTSQAEAVLPDQRQEAALSSEAGSGAAAITADAPTHYFRMMKELTMLGYFTSEIGYTQHMRYVEAPGRFDPCVDYTPGEKLWAPHA
jgi:hypothetical protein